MVGGMSAPPGQEFPIVNAEGVMVGSAVINSTDEVTNLDQLKLVPKKTKFIAEGYGVGRNLFHQVPISHSSIKEEVDTLDTNTQQNSVDSDITATRDDNSNSEEGVDTVTQAQVGQGLVLVKRAKETLQPLQTVAKEQDDSQEAGRAKETIIEHLHTVAGEQGDSQKVGEAIKRTSMTRKAKRDRPSFDEDFDDEEELHGPKKSSPRKVRKVECPNGCGQYPKDKLARHRNTEKCKKKLMK